MAIITGTAGNDVLHDTLGDDTIDAGAGDDQITVTAEVDTVSGGPGNDILIVNYSAFDVRIGTNITGSLASGYSGGIGFDPEPAVTFSGIEHFHITSTASRDHWIVTFDGNDIAITGAGKDRIDVGSGNDRVEAGGGDDVVTVGTGNDTADGGDGVDGISADLRAATGAINWNLVTNSYSGAIGSFTNFEYFNGVFTGSGNDVIVTSSGSHSDAVRLGAGDDRATVIGGPLDYIYGGPGTDTLVIDWSAATLPVRNSGYPPSENTVDGGMDGQFNDWGDTLTAGGHGVNYFSIEKFDITSGSGNDEIVTFHGDDRIVTGAGDDIVNSGAGNDIFDGGAGDDSIGGGAGNDRLDGGAGSDILIGNDGDDVYVVDNPGDFVLEYGGEGTDTVSTGLGDKNAPAYALYYIPSEVENLVATSNAGQGVGGNNVDNIVTAGSGADLIAMHQDGIDNVNAGAGADFIYFGDKLTSADVINGGLGRDTLAILGPYGSLSLGANVTNIERIELYSSSGPFIYNITLADSVNSPHPNFFEFVALSLGANEHVNFNGSSDTDSRYFIRGGAGNDTLRAGAGNDRIVGNDGHDSLFGNAGDDTLVGGNGQDNYDTGTGSDRIEVLSAAQSTSTGHDFITGFDPTVDRIDVSGTFAGWGAAQTGALSTATFDAQLAAAVNAALGNGQAVKFTASSGDQNGKTFVIYDANGDGNYTAGTDYVFQFVGAQPNLESHAIFV